MSFMIKFPISFIFSLTTNFNSCPETQYFDFHLPIQSHCGRIQLTTLPFLRFSPIAQFPNFQKTVPNTVFN